MKIHFSSRKQNHLNISRLFKIGSPLAMALVLLFSIEGCTNSRETKLPPPTPAMKDASATIKPIMMTFRSDLDALAPYLYSQTEFQDPKNEVFITENLTRLDHHVKAIAEIKATMLGKRDPSIAYAANELKSNIGLALQAFKEGQKPFAQTTLKESVQQCFYCHTRNDGGSNQDLTKSEKKTAKWLNDIDKVDYLVALREFEKAHITLLNFFRDGDFKKVNPLESETLAKKLLALEIRVKRDPTSLLSTLRTLEELKGLPVNIRSQLKTWHKSAEKWKKEKTKLSGIDGAKTLLFGSKQSPIESLVKKEINDVELLRVTTLLHDYLETKPSNINKAPALLLLGVSYERIRDLGFWNLHEFYFEDCIRTNPHSTIAEQCYSNWNDSITAGFSGSAGTQIPAPIEKKRNLLKDLAFIKE